MKLTDLNLICLEGVLEYLELGDLLSAASANKRLNRAACFVYVQEYREKMVKIEKWRVSEKRIYRISKSFIEVNDLRTSLQMLRCFGQFINELECWRSTYILSYVNEYCSGYLSELRLYLIPKDHLNVLVTPFSKVEEVSINNCYCNVGKYWLKDTFPRMKTLKIDLDDTCFQPFENEFFAHHFPHLEDLEIRIDYVAGDPNQGNENFKTMFRLNQQLKKFCCVVINPRRIFDANFFQSIIEHIQNLEALDITGNTGFYDNFNGNALHLRNVIDFRFNLCYRLRHAEDFIPGSFRWQNRIPPFLFDNLKCLTKPHHDLTREEEIYFCGFVQKHPLIKKLMFELNIDWHMSRKNIVKIEQMLPFLTEIVLDRWSYSVDDILSVIKLFRLVKLFTFRIRKPIENLLERLPDDWIVNKQYPHFLIQSDLVITLERRH